MGIVVSMLKWLGIAIALILLGIALFVFSMRFSDGPWEMVAGGAFTSGQVYSGSEPDWSPMRKRTEVQFQLLDPARSRTTWIVEHDNRIFIPSGYMTTTIGKLWKQWPAEAEEDGRALLRVDDDIYPRQMVRIQQDPALGSVLRLIAQKYVAPMTAAQTGEAPDMRELHLEMVQQVADGTLWIFELQSRQ